MALSELDVFKLLKPFIKDGKWFNVETIKQKTSPKTLDPEIYYYLSEQLNKLFISNYLDRKLRKEVYFPHKRVSNRCKWVYRIKNNEQLKLNL